MTEPNVKRPKIAFISSREMSGESMAGRLHTAHSILQALSSWADVHYHRLPSVLTDFTVGRAFGAMGAFLRQTLSGRPMLPLQCALYANGSDLAAVIDRLPADLNAAYIDGVRSYALLETLRRRRPDLRLVVDLDDLMSRRMDLLLQADQPLSPGYLTKRLPKPLLRLIMSRTAGRLVVRYERATLKGVEQRIAQLADAIVLLSSGDADRLRSFSGGVRAQFAVILPAREPAPSAVPFTSPDRFIFVGSDALTQNRLTIDYLVDFWRRRAIQTPLVLCGLTYRHIEMPPNVSSLGYVERIEDVYDGKSVLITPSLIGGGIKTKVIEAFAFGAPVVGNALTFESMPLAGYPLTIEDETQLEALVRDPAAHTALFVAAAADGAAYIRRWHDLDDIRTRWRALMVPGAPT